MASKKRGGRKGSRKGGKGARASTAKRGGTRRTLAAVSSSGPPRFAIQRGPRRWGLYRKKRGGGYKRVVDYWFTSEKQAADWSSGKFEVPRRPLTDD